MEQIRSQRFRQDLLEIADGDARLTHACFHLNNFVYGPEIVRWLLRHGLKGARLHDWIKEKHDGSILEAVKAVVAQVNHSTKKPVLVGKDYLAR